MEIKYPLDENQEQYFAATHKDAVQGIDLDELKNNVTDLQNNNDKSKSNIDELMNFKKTVIGDTGWVDFQLLPGIKKNTKGGENGFKTGIREIRIGHIRIKSIRFNAENIPHNVQIAQMPVGFVTDNHSFYATTDGNSSPVRVSIDKGGGISIYLAGNDKNKPQSEVWIYQQYMWIE
ncbi:hypothetical protein ACVDHH_01405 [Staphylococcus saprophyticus]